MSDNENHFQIILDFFRKARAEGPGDPEYDAAFCAALCEAASAERASIFRLDDEGLVVFERPDEATADDMIRAAKVCPVDAILIWDGDGNAVAP